MNNQENYELSEISMNLSGHQLN